MVWLLITLVLAVWLAGIVRFWRLQSLSRATVTVTALDRVMTILWLPLYVLTLSILGISYLFGSKQRAK